MVGDNFEGLGILTITDGDEKGRSYEGEFHQSDYHGRGVMKYEDGSIYFG